MTNLAETSPSGIAMTQDSYQQLTRIADVFGTTPEMYMDQSLKFGILLGHIATDETTGGPIHIVFEQPTGIPLGYELTFESKEQDEASTDDIPLCLRQLDLEVSGSKERIVVPAKAALLIESSDLAAELQVSSEAFLEASIAMWWSWRFGERHGRLTYLDLGDNYADLNRQFLIDEVGIDGL